MDPITRLPDAPVTGDGPMAAEFRKRQIATFRAACTWVHQLPYGYNGDRDDLYALFKEGMGSCTTKHAVIATLAGELELDVVKNIGIYAMTEEIVSGSGQILEAHGLPYLPMVHCFLAHGDYRVDLTEGNHNGKNMPIDDFLHAEAVIPNISAKAEYLLYRRALVGPILSAPALKGVDLKTLLHAREAGLALLRGHIRP